MKLEDYKLIKLVMILMMIMIVVILFLSVVGCNAVSAEKSCNVDIDCTANKCCHADDAVNVGFAPDCTGIFCTQDCVPRTLDCGQGEIKCIEGKCKIVIF